MKTPHELAQTGETVTETMKVLVDGQAQPREVRVRWLTKNQPVPEGWFFVQDWQGLVQILDDKDLALEARSRVNAAKGFMGGR